MKYLFLNGSPKAEAGNTEIFIRQIIKEMKTKSEVRYIRKEDPKRLAKDICTYDTVIFVMPLYVFAMPGIVMKLLEEMTYDYSKISMGFVIQQGFVESSHAEILMNYCMAQTKRMRAQYIGTIIKGNAEGIRHMPESMNKKLFSKLHQVGSDLETMNLFQREIEFSKPYQLSKIKAFFYQCAYRLGLNNLFWHQKLKENHAFENRFDQPYNNQ